MLALVDRKAIQPTTFQYVLVSDDIGSLEAIRDRDEEDRAIAKARINLSDYLTPLPTRDDNLSKKLDAIAKDVEAKAPPVECGTPGACWLWILNRTHELTRALINRREIQVNGGAKYLYFPHQFDSDRSVDQRQEMTVELARRAKVELGVDAGYYFVIGSNDPDIVPFYNSDELGSHLHYNYDFGQL